MGCGSDSAGNPEPGNATTVSPSNSGSGSASPAANVAGNTPLHVSLGLNHGCAVTSSGGVRCWGLPDEGQLGNGESQPEGEAVPEPVAATGLNSGMVAVAAGGYHSCALGKDGSVQCWGKNGFGQLGNDSSEDSAIPVAVSGLPAAVEIQAGYGHTCARLEDDTLRCWGSNRWGELGDGSSDMSGQSDAHTPREVPGLGPVLSFALGVDNTCAVTRSGSAKCWGNNNSGQLGTGTTEAAPSPVQVVGLETGVTQIGVGSSVGCAVTAQGTAKCWGDNNRGQLGDKTTVRSLLPVDVSDLTDAVVIQPGYVHTCVLTTDASVKCWGDGSNGQLGSHTDADNKSQPGPGLSGVVQLSSQGSSNCAVLSSPKTIQCWGSNSYGVLGTDGGGSARTPQTLPGF